MTALTVRLSDEKHRRLKALAESCGTSLNRLFDEMTTVMLAGFDAETRFKIRAAGGVDKTDRGLELLKKAGT
jgi:hypothetical protein